MQDAWIMVIISVVIAMFAIVLLFVIAVYVREYWKFLDVPHERPKPLLATFRALCCCGDNGGDDAEEKEEHYRRLYFQFKHSGPFCGFYDGLTPRVVVLDRELMKQILIKDFSNFNDHDVYNNPKHDPLSGDLYSRYDKAWKEMRYRLEPTFMLEQMNNLYATTFAESDKLLHTIEQLQATSPGAGTAGSENSGLVLEDVRQHMRRYVLGSIARGVFGLRTPQLQQKYPFAEFETMTQLALTTTRHGPFLTWLCKNQPALSRRFRLAITNRKVEIYFRALIEDVVEQRETEGSAAAAEDGGCDYMQLIFDIMTQELSTHETEKESDARSLREHLLGELAAHAFTFVRQGYESIAHTLTHALYELATHPDVQERAREEVASLLAKHDDTWNYECVHELKYLGQVISETVRMYPTHPYLKRRTLHDYRLPDYPKYVLSRNMRVIIPVNAMHHDEILYPEPETFKPERFSPEEFRRRDPCTWLGYGAGPRSCIGFYYSQLQMRIILARLLLRYRFKLDNRHVVIRYQDGVNLLLEPCDSTTTSA